MKLGHFPFGADESKGIFKLYDVEMAGKFNRHDKIKNKIYKYDYGKVENHNLMVSIGCILLGIGISLFIGHLAAGNSGKF